MNRFKIALFSILPFFNTANAQNELELIDKSSIVHKDVAKRIAILETGHFKGKDFKVTHNLFGFKRNSRKLYKGVYKGYAAYKNLTISIKDYQLWEKRNIEVFHLTTKAKFIRFVERTYCPDNKSYARKLRSITL